MPLVVDIYSMSRALLNDQLGAVYNNEVLRPYLNIAFRDLGSLLERSNIPVTNASSIVIDFPAGRDELAPDDVDFPTGLVEIQGVYQRQNSSQSWGLITKLEFLTPAESDVDHTYISAWSYQENILRFTPASGDLEVKLDYVKSAVFDITTPDDTTDIEIIGSYNYLGYRTAALASMYVGENETRAATLQKQADDEWNSMEGVSTKGKQSIHTRRRPFRSRNWGGSALGW